MHSKWKLWEYLNANKNKIELNPGLNAIHCYHPLAFKFVKDKWDRSCLSEGKITVLMGKEATIDWFEDNIKALTLFGTNDSYLIHHAEDIPTETKSAIIENPLDLKDRVLVLNYNKEDDLLRKIKKIKDDSVNSLSIVAPAFWEEDQLLNFLIKNFNLYFDYDAIEYFKEKVPFDIYNYYQFLEKILLIKGDQSVSRNDLEDILDIIKFDNFKLAESFGSKKLKLFYEGLIEAYENGEDLIGPLYFLQSHILKLYDQSYLEKKSKLTKYDKQILQQSKIWNKEDLVKAQNHIGELLIELKQNSSYFLDHLRLKRSMMIKV